MRSIALIIMLVAISPAITAASATSATSAASAAFANPSAADALVTVTVDINVFGVDATDCTVSVPASANGGDVLDAAVADGCLLEWSAGEFEGYGRYVTSVDYITETVPTYWALYDNGAYSDVGIDFMTFDNGDVLGLDYTQWVA